jgi:ElaB/YqjD/DUF883 family membrane-anchored ribosome-binding protein
MLRERENRSLWKPLIFNGVKNSPLLAQPMQTEITMPNSTDNNPFPATRQDASDLKKTAVDAAKDLGSTAAVHAEKAKQTAVDAAKDIGSTASTHIERAKQTATDAARDLSSTAAVHAEKARGQVRSLASHAREEGSAQLEQVRGQAAEVIDSARDYVNARPLTCVGVALAIGFLFGLSRRRD